MMSKCIRFLRSSKLVHLYYYTSVSQWAYETEKAGDKIQIKGGSQTSPTWLSRLTMWVSTELGLQPEDPNSLSKGLSPTPERQATTLSTLGPPNQNRHTLLSHYMLKWRTTTSSYVHLAQQRVKRGDRQCASVATKGATADTRLRLRTAVAHSAWVVLSYLKSGS